MGDMADFITQDWDFDDDGPDPPVVCRYCGRFPYWWDQDDKGKWRLYTEKGRVHACKSRSKPEP